MPLHCPICNQSFFPEVGFYYGAMYVSYMISLAFAIPLFFLLWFIFGFHLIGLTVAVSVALLSIFPFAYRYSRVLWIYVNVPFDKNLNREEN